MKPKNRIFWPFAVYRVTGESMLPAFREGDRVLVWTWSAGRVGDVVVFKKNAKTMVKRISRIEHGQIHVRGDHRPKSNDSADFGALKRSQVVGKVIARIPASS